MKFALIDNTKTIATKGAKGLCPNCNSELIAKCGDVKVHHWAHKGIRNCDPWWENETDWHRSWKDNFSTDWQEVILTDEVTGEKHIADICTTHRLVIEFQHSHIAPEERTKRESFYKKMVWVIDGARLKRDFPRFLKAKERFRLTNKKGFFLVDFPDECFPAAWIGSSVPVLFDFKGAEGTNDPEGWRNHLYCLLPKSNQRQSVLVIISRKSFVNGIITGVLFEQKPEPQKQTAPVNINSPVTISRRPSEYIYHRGRYIKRQRF